MASTAAKGVDPRLPVLVGTGQLSQRVDRGEPSLEPTEMMAEALRRAAADAGCPAGTGTGAGSTLLRAADSVRTVGLLSWRYRNPGALVAGLVGASPRHSIVTTAGGNSPQMLVNQAARDIASGAADVVLIAGAEAWRTRTAARGEGTKPAWVREGDDTAPAEVVGSDAPLSHPAEVARGLFMPVQIYPLFENALRAADQRPLAEHQRRLAELWSGFSSVAATNPYAWTQRAYSPQEVGTVGPENRMIGFPYPKLMNSNNSVEQAAALVLCSVERARALAIPTNRWVFLHAGTDAHDTPFLSHRQDMHSSPAIRTAGRAALDLAGVGADDLAHVDLYSCFPSAVEIAAGELGLCLDRPLTVTGGLTFAGGPWNNYVTHAIAAMADVLRGDELTTFGLCTANGGYLTKHAFGVYATSPPASGRFAYANPQADVDAATRPRVLCEEWDGPVTVESFTVMYGRDGDPETGILAVLLDDGRRAWGTTTKVDAMLAMVTDDRVVGRAGHLGPDGHFWFD